MQWEPLFDRRNLAWLRRARIASFACLIALAVIGEPAHASLRMHEDFETYPLGADPDGRHPGDDDPHLWELEWPAGQSELSVASGGSFAGGSSNAQVLRADGDNGSPFDFLLKRRFDPISGEDPRTPIVRLTVRLRALELEGDGSPGSVDHGVLSLSLMTPSGALVARMRVSPAGDDRDWIAIGSERTSLGVPIQPLHWYQLELVLHLADVGRRTRGEFDVRLLDLSRPADGALPIDVTGHVAKLAASEIGEIRIRGSGVRNPAFELDDLRVEAVSPSGANYFDYVDATLFLDSEGALKLDEAFELFDHLYLPPSSQPYLVRNPVTISSERIQVLHGAGRQQTRLAPVDPTKTLFRVYDARYFELAGLSLEGGGVPSASAIVFRPGAAAHTASLLDVEIRDFGIWVKAAGEYVFQQLEIVLVNDQRDVGLKINDDDALVYVVGGKFRRSEQSHIVLARGHLEVYGASFNDHNVGSSTSWGEDIRLIRPSSRADQGAAHIVAGIRSEGAMHFDSDPSTLVAMNGDVDVVLKANHLARPGGSGPPSQLVRFASNGTGTAWLIGNHGDQLVGGSAPDATVIALGNNVEAGIAGSGEAPELLAQTGASPGAALNLYDPSKVCAWGDPPDPDDPGDCAAQPDVSRFFHPGCGLAGPGGPGCLSHPTPLPAIPETLHPSGRVPFLVRPHLTAPLRGIQSVRSFGAVGDGLVDDTLALQNAIDVAGPALFFPPGHYRVSETLLYHHSAHPDADAQDFGRGGWFVGSGSEEVVISRSDPGAVFASEGMARVTVQGLSFAAGVDPAATDGEAAFELADVADDNGVALGGRRIAVQSNSFDDVRFAGGFYGLGIVLRDHAQGSQNLCVGCRFVGSRIGFAAGGPNALTNYVIGAEFSDNEVDVSPGVEPREGSKLWNQGKVGVLGARSRHVGRAVFGPSKRTTYVAFLRTDATRLSESSCGGGLRSVVVDGLDATASEVEDPFVAQEAAGGYALLHATVAAANPRFDFAGCPSRARGLLLIESAFGPAFDPAPDFSPPLPEIYDYEEILPR